MKQKENFSNNAAHFLQSFLLIFLMTVSSIITYEIGQDFVYSFIKSLNKKEITEEVVEEIEALVQKELTLDDQELIGVFFYQDDFNTRVKFEANTSIKSPVVTNIQQDSEYGRMLEFHKHNICYQKSALELDQDSKLYNAFLTRKNLTKEKGYYTSCPILVNDKLIGYIGSFYSLDVAGRPSIRVSRLRFVASKMSSIFSTYF